MGRTRPRTIRLSVAGTALTGLALLTGCSIGPFGSTSSTAGTPLSGANPVAQPSQCHGYATYGVPNVTPLDPHKTYLAQVTTNKGSFTIKLLPKEAPATVQSFIFLARHHYFDGVTFHRIVPGFVIQGGDPTGTGMCGPGYAFGTENTVPPYTRGTVAMARTQDPHSNGSQFFIVLQNGTSLDQNPGYSIFGHVTGGMGTIDAIAHVPLGPSPDGEMSHPLTKVYMKSVRIVVQ